MLTVLPDWYQEPTGHHRLETALQGGITFNMLAVLVGDRSFDN